MNISGSGSSHDLSSRSAASSNTPTAITKSGKSPFNSLSPNFLSNGVFIHDPSGSDPRSSPSGQKFQDEALQELSGKKLESLSKSLVDLPLQNLIKIVEAKEYPIQRLAEELISGRLSNRLSRVSHHFDKHLFDAAVKFTDSGNAGLSKNSKLFFDSNVSHLDSQDLLKIAEHNEGSCRDKAKKLVIDRFQKNNFGYSRRYYPSVPSYDLAVETAVGVVNRPDQDLSKAAKKFVRRNLHKVSSYGLNHMMEDRQTPCKSQIKMILKVRKISHFFTASKI